MRLSNIDTIIYSFLSEIDAEVYQIRPDVIKKFPTVVFATDVQPEYTLNREVVNEAIEIRIDIWTKMRSEGKELVDTIESLLIDENIRLIRQNNLVDPDFGYSHINLIFNLLK